MKNCHFGLYFFVYAFDVTEKWKIFGKVKKGMKKSDWKGEKTKYDNKKKEYKVEKGWKRLLLHTYCAHCYF